MTETETAHFTHPARIGIIQPRVARNELPWVNVFLSPTLKELNPLRIHFPWTVLQPFQGWPDCAYTQGSSFLATLGYMITTPLGLPKTMAEPEAYLILNLFSGIGPAKAKKLRNPVGVAENP